MSAFTASAGAQVSAEVRSRLRSPATLVALVLLLAGSILWIPDPKGSASSLSWTLANGKVEGPVYSAAYIGFAVSVLVTIFVPLIGFYLVAGSVRRDRQSGVGAILAATPLTKAQYLAGKFLAHAAYLAVTVGLAAAAGLVAWIRFGSGAFAPMAFIVPVVLFGLPVVAITASLAVLFDVTPVLRSRGGLVLWFFAFMLLLVALPFSVSGGPASGQASRVALVDPAGAATQHALARLSVPQGSSVSTGLLIHDKPLERVAWSGISVTPFVVAVRAGNLLLALLPLALAVLAFDRFDPARRRRSSRPSRAERAAARSRAPVEEAAGEPAPARAVIALTPVSARPSAARAVLAEALLIWKSASFLKWPTLAVSLAAAVLPSPAFSGLAAAFFLLLVPVLSEVAARESLAGTRGLVFSQPGVPRSAVVWKAAAVAVFLLTLAAPMLARRALSGPAPAAAFLAGLLFVTGASVGLGWLTGGGKLFSGAFLTVLYAAVNRVPGADFAGVFGSAGASSASAVYAGIGLVCLAGALVRERATA